MMFYILSEMFEPLFVCTPVGDLVLGKKIYRSFPISLYNKVTLVDWVDLDMFDFDVIFGMDSLHACYVSIDCRTHVVNF